MKRKRCYQQISKNKVHKADESVKTKLAPAERDNRIKDQKARLEGLRFRGEEECSHQSYDLVLHMLEKDTLLYLPPDKFPTRRHELLQKKAPKEITIDQSALIVRDKHMELTCATTTELEATNALRRRALAFDLVKACDFHVMNAFHADLFDHLHQTPPLGYSSVSLAQLLRADRAAWVLIAERITTLKRDEQGKLPLEAELQQVLSHPSVTFHLLPLPAAGTTKTASPKPKPQPRRSRSPKRPSGPAPSKGKGKGKKGSKRGRGPNVPKGLINKNLQTSSGERLCWAFNLDQGCPNAKPGERCNRGIHPLRRSRLCKASQPPKTPMTATSGSFNFARTSSSEARAISFEKPPLNQLFAIEIFAGSGKLTASIRAMGLPDSFGIDLKLPLTLRNPIIKYDLTYEEHLELVRNLIRSPQCCFVHFAPPCGTSSRARLIQRKGRWNPPIVRTDQTS